MWLYLNLRYSIILKLSLVLINSLKTESLQISVNYVCFFTSCNITNYFCADEEIQVLKLDTNSEITITTVTLHCTRTVYPSDPTSLLENTENFKTKNQSLKLILVKLFLYRGF